jgi:hypothetical protein
MRRSLMLTFANDIYWMPLPAPPLPHPQERDGERG